MVGVLVAALRGLLPPDFLSDALFSNAILDLPEAPRGAAFLSECFFSQFETSNRVAVRPRRRARRASLPIPGYAGVKA